MAEAAKVTISLPNHILEAVDAVAKKRKAPRSCIIAEILKKTLEDLERQEMMEGYIALTKENVSFARKAVHAAREILPEWQK